MSYDKALIAHKLQRWDHYITEYHLPQWESIDRKSVGRERVC